MFIQPRLFTALVILALLMFFSGSNPIMGAGPNKLAAPAVASPHLTDSLRFSDSTDQTYLNLASTPTAPEVLVSPPSFPRESNKPKKNLGLKEPQWKTPATKTNEVVKVTDPKFGAKGDGVTIDKNAVQAAIDYAKNRGGGKVYFPKGTYLVYGIKLPPNLTLVGEGIRKSILKAPDRVDLLIKKKFWRMFVTVSTPLFWGYKYESDNDSPPLVFQNLVIDYNGPHQLGWNDRYNGEQNFCLELGASAKKAGRLKVIFDNCEVRYSCSDGVTICENVDASFSNCDFISNRRGGITAVGMHSKITGKKLRFLDSISTPGGTQFVAIHCEPSLGSLGYNKSRRVDWDLDDVYVQGHITMVPLVDGVHNDWGGSVVRLNNVRHDPDNPRYGFNFSLRNCDFTMTNCYLQGPGHIFGCFSDILGATHHPTVANCTFIGRRTPKGALPYGAVGVQFNTSGRPSVIKNATFVFDGCTFRLGADIGTSIPAICYTGGKDTVEQNNLLVLKNCVFAPDIKYSVWFPKVLELDNPTWQNPNGYLLHADGWGKEFNLSVKNTHLTTGKYLDLRGIDGTRDCHLAHTNVTINKANNVINCLLGGLDSSQLHLSGKRTINAGDNLPPDSGTHGLKGDEYRLLNGKIYDCTKSGGRHSPSVWNGPRP